MQDWIKYFLFIFLGAALLSFSFGVWEMQYLGSYGNQGVWAPYFYIIGSISSGDLGQAFAFIFTDWTSILSSFWNILIWNYAILATDVGTIAKAIIFWPLSAAMFLGLLAFFKQLSPFGST